MNNVIRVASLVVITCVASHIYTQRAAAGIGTLTGSEWHLWTDAKYSIVVGSLTEIASDERTGLTRAAFYPLATIAGTFDPSAKSKVQLHFYVSSTTSSIHSLPPEGSLVMAVFKKDDEAVRDRDGFFISDNCLFMPGGSALVPLTGVDDARITETLRAVQLARQKEKPSPYPKKQDVGSTTKPS